MSNEFKPISEAKKDGTLYVLLIDVHGNGDVGDCGAGFEDDTYSRTIGFNNFDDDGEDRWVFPGWCWCNDHVVEQGYGKPVMFAELPKWDRVLP